jgi:uncharacterized membrane protein
VYETSVAIHVVAAIAGFGATFTYPVIQLVAERRDATAFGLASILAISRWVAVPAAVVVGVTGVYQATSGPYRFGDTWVGLGFGLYLGVMAVATGYLAPAYRRALEAPDRAAYGAAMRGPNVVGPVLSAAIVAIAVLMVVKPM